MLKLTAKSGKCQNWRIAWHIVCASPRRLRIHVTDGLCSNDTKFVKLRYIMRTLLRYLNGPVFICLHIITYLSGLIKVKTKYYLVQCGHSS